MIKYSLIFQFVLVIVNLIMFVLLQLKPAPNNGSFDAIKHLLKPLETSNLNLSFAVAKYLSELLLCCLCDILLLDVRPPTRFVFSVLLSTVLNYNPGFF